jgi:hypothetical protein
VSCSLKALLVVAVVAAAGCGDDSRGPRTAPAVHPSERALTRLGLTRRRPRGLREACRRLAARRRPAPLGCPPVVPRGAWALRYERASRSDYQMEMLSPSIHPSSGGHWAVGAGAPGAFERVLHPSTSRLVEPGITRTRTRLGPVAATRYVVPPDYRGLGIYRGHVSYTWTVEGVEYFLSVHGRRNSRRARVMAEELSRVVRAEHG